MAALVVATQQYRYQSDQQQRKPRRDHEVVDFGAPARERLAVGHLDFDHQRIAPRRPVGEDPRILAVLILDHPDLLVRKEAAEDLLRCRTGARHVLVWPGGQEQGAVIAIEFDDILGAADNAAQEAGEKVGIDRCHADRMAIMQLPLEPHGEEIGASTDIEAVRHGLAAAQIAAAPRAGKSNRRPGGGRRDLVDRSRCEPGADGIGGRVGLDATGRRDDRQRSHRGKARQILGQQGAERGAIGAIGGAPVVQSGVQKVFDRLESPGDLVFADAGQPFGHDAVVGEILRAQAVGMVDGGEDDDRGAGQQHQAQGPGQRRGTGLGGVRVRVVGLRVGARHVPYLGPLITIGSRP